MTQHYCLNKYNSSIDKTHIYHTHKYYWTFYCCVYGNKHECFN